MTVLRSLFLAARSPKFCQRPVKADLQYTCMALMATQTISRQALTKSLDLVTDGSVPLTGRAGEPMTLVTDKPRPLVIMLAWMLAKKKHVNKYCEFYVKRGYDVLTINVTPWQLLWPPSGTQVVAEEVVQFLHKNTLCQPLFLHGFSVGGYMWGEVMVKMKQDLERYQPILDRIIGQTWDSAADVTELQVGLPLAVFPRNPILRLALSKYIAYHMSAFHEEATSHYIRSSQMFHTTLVQKPALLLLSKTDPVGSIASNLRVKETWESMGIKVDWKIWDDSKHVSHYLKYKDEYVKLLDDFLMSLNKTESSQKETVNEGVTQREKLQAKL